MRMTRAVSRVLCFVVLAFVAACNQSSNTQSSTATTSPAPAASSFTGGITRARGGITRPTVGTTPAATANAAIVAFSAAAYTVTHKAGSVTVDVNRLGYAATATSVHYSTSNGSAAAGQNYTPRSGTLSWAAGDASPKTIVVPVSSTVTGGAV